MAIEMKVPSVGESVTEVTIATWIKKDGDFVEMDEVICELESDKATFELPSESAGILRIKAQEGETLAIGAPICSIEAADAPNSESSIETKEESEPAKAEVEETLATPKSSGKTVGVEVPAVGESITEVTISSWIKKDGDTVEMDEIICELESDKATFELPSPTSGLLKIVAAEGDTIAIGEVIANIQEGVAGNTNASTEQAPSSPGIQENPSNKDSYAAGHPAPAAAKILAEKGISADSVKGTGVDGRITKEDAQKASVAPKAAPAPATQESAASKTPSGEREQRREKMSSLRKTISKRLVAVKNETAMLTTFNEVDMKPIMDLRKSYKDKFKEIHGVGLGFMSFFTKACSTALLEFPGVNAFIDGEEIVYNDYADIAIAVSAPRGLVVPVIRNAEQLSFQGIESEVVRLATKARDNKLTLEEMTGGTFTITNGGIFGSMLSTPIINAPQSAILGMHNIVERPVAINGQVEIRPIMYLALSYDHRIIDGKDSVSFLVRVKQLLEDPMRMLLQV